MKRVVLFTALRPRLGQHQRIMEEVRQLAKDMGEDRILKLVEVITDDVEGSNRQGGVWFVLESGCVSDAERIYMLCGFDSILRGKDCLF